MPNTDVRAAAEGLPKINRRKPRVSDALKDADSIKEVLEAYRGATSEARARAIAWLREAEEAQP